VGSKCQHPSTCTAVLQSYPSTVLLLL
jgi:hypothetical protein